MNLRNLVPFGGQSELLVCETDGFSLRAAVIKNVAYKTTVLFTAESPQSDMAEALKEVIEQLKASGWKVGGKAVVLSPAVLSTLVELPINPAKPRPIAQMQELIRWEVEPLLMQHTTRWSVGHLLVGQGYMTAEQAQTVMDMQQGKANPTGQLQTTDKLSLRRFGDLAEELGYIRRSQLNACLSGQEWLKADDEQIACGWSAQSEVEDVPGSYGWLVSCVSKSLLDRWHSAFKAHNLNLESMYPLTGSSSSLHIADNISSVILESHKGMTFATQLKNNKIVVQQPYVNPEQSDVARCLESFHSLTTASNTSIELSSWENDIDSLITELRSSLERDVIAITISPDPTKVSSGMLGAATHFFGSGKSHLVADVRVDGPQLPLIQRPQTRLAIVAGCLILTLVGSEVYLMISKNQVLSNKQQVDARWKKIDSANKEIAKKVAEINKRKAEIANKEQEQKRTETLIAFYANDIPQRTAIVKNILGILQSTVNDQVIINSIDEYGRRATFNKQAVNPQFQQDKRIEVENFNLDAWALSETAAQSFIQDLKQAIEPWQLEIRDPTVSAQAGPLNLSGFGIALRIVKLKMPEQTASKATKK